MLKAMHSHSTRLTNMNKENRPAAKLVEPTIRITRARAKGLATSAGLAPSRPITKQGKKQILHHNSKRSAPDESQPSVSVTGSLQHKKRAVLKDTTNVSFDNPRTSYSNAAKLQPSKQGNRGTRKNVRLTSTVSLETPQVQGGVDAKLSKELPTVKREESQQTILEVNIIENVADGENNSIEVREFGVTDMIVVKQSSCKHTQEESPSKKELKPSEKLEALNDPKIADVDSNHKNPQMCSLYAPDVYSNLRVMELDRKPSVDYMEVLQKDITPNMRGILIDWLVEVSEEYRLVPDTLYLTVNLIDRYLSQNHIEKQKLQLLGVTCMLIASKYEEICAPGIEEFCFITDNTYKREEVIRMESQVLNFLGFQLSIPTTKKFLRRFIQAAQASCKVPCVELEFLANYLAELTLVQYSFLKFLPSLVAASAVFLAKWTLNQSNHPWNPTLEHYSSYRTSDLKLTVLALQELQLNTRGCPLNAIRAKYGQQKFKCVAALSSPKPVDSAF